MGLIDRSQGRERKKEPESARRVREWEKRNRRVLGFTKKEEFGWIWQIRFRVCREKGPIPSRGRERERMSDFFFYLPSRPIKGVLFFNGSGFKLVNGFNL